MKPLLILSLMFTLFGCSPFGVISSGSNSRPQGPVVYYEYSYSTMARYPAEYYRIDRDADGHVCIAWSKQHDADIAVIRGPEDLLGRVAGIVSANKLYKLKNSYRPRMDVLDGFMWHAAIGYEGDSIYTGGSNAWPPSKQSMGIVAINGMIEELVAASSESDIIARRSHDDR